MSHAQLQAARELAQSTLASYMGMAADAEGNALYKGAPLTVVWGTEQVFEEMLPGGGYRRRTVQRCEFTRTQVDALPESKTEIIRTDITPPIPYRIDVVTPLGADMIRLDCIRPGPAQ